jgi:hypothetical protein
MKENKVAGYVPKLLFRIYLNLKEKFDPTPPPKEEEMYCVEICEKLINNPESKLTIAPISNRRFIKNDSKDMFIVIGNRQISIINHVYSYNVYIESDQLYKKIVDNFDNVVEQKRQELEDEIKHNIKHSLKSILNKVSQNSH